MTNSSRIVLSIAGFDPSSGAGATADLKTISAHGLYGVSCLTALTLQTTQGVTRFETVSANFVRETLNALLEDSPLVAVKIGMLGSGDVAAAVVEFLRKRRLPNVVLDPVLRASSGMSLLDDAGVTILKRDLLGLATVITPNLAEAGLLTGTEVIDIDSMKAACRAVHELGGQSVVVTGGHLAQPTDVLSTAKPDGTLSFRIYPGNKIETRNTHGSGCAFSTALACQLALGSGLADAVAKAKIYVEAALRNSYATGKGIGPLNHLFGLRKEN